MSTVTTEIPSWRTFPVTVRRLRRLSPSFLRVTFTGDDLDRFADNGFDVRVKLLLPAPACGLSKLPDGADWFTKLRALPVEEQCPLRTYTVRAVRQTRREVDVDIVIHPEAPGGDGPVATWARRIQTGDEIVLLGPNGEFDGFHGGMDFQPPDSTHRVLIVGDETAVPAACAIVERLPGHIETQVLLEVPETADARAIEADLPETPACVRVAVLPRDGAEHGAKLIPAVREVMTRLLPHTASGTEVEDVDVDTTLLWESPGAEARTSHGLYAWLAGEAAVIKTLRRHLVSERGVDRKSVAFMGYWRRGKAEY
ncbi:siderophore-interacting protein [Stackebrandtia nassauensis]|uniref:FAD-binding 9 siderophore-interacting domain protein n=1 Tax=Stackebrandtia nassauensis (strain DSM 44728 / CIP 108903 / NRRL B-16338 / NBRC 102104 / LLR-40K-21) TaxID=446470 RepID=D3PYT7_STANL|nr:siderophore-interacting protein [Stackebrandtia nassauensis]ADD43520.1 FAD-binding 9 siderophore-interacting domain protein [Stackebrandtia nassauensis DSM 44728]